MKTKCAFLMLSLVLFCVPVHVSAEGRISYDLGVFALDEENLSEAEQHFLAAVSQEPDNPYSNHFLGKTYLQMGRYDDALRYLDQARQLEPTLTGLEYDRGMTHYKAGNYEQALAIFSDLTQKEPANALVVYYTGMCYYKLQRFRPALEYLYKAAEQNSSIQDNSYYFAGISHQRLGETEKAKERLSFVAEYATSDTLRHSAGQWLETIGEQDSKEAPYSLFLKLGLQYDDSIRLDPLDQDIAADQGDFLVTGLFNGRYNFLNSPDHRFGIGYSHYLTRHQDLSEFDITASMPSLYFQARLNNSLTFICSYLYSYFWVDSASYLQRHLLRPELLWRLDRERFVRFTFSPAVNDYQIDNGRDGFENDLAISLYQEVQEKKGRLFAGLSYADYNADHPDQDYDLFRVRIGYAYSMPSDYKLRLLGRLDYKKYNNIDSLSNVQRQDDKYAVGASLSRPLFAEWLRLRGEYLYVRNESNIAAYSYDKNVLTLAGIAKF